MVLEAVRTEFITLAGSQLKDPQLIDPVREFLERVYGAYYLGNKSFDEQTLPNTSEILYLLRSGRIEAAIPFNGNRAMMLAGDTDLKDARALGYSPGSMILGEAVRTHPSMWATVSSKNEDGPNAMTYLFTRPELGFELVEDIETITALYRSLGNGFLGDKFWGMPVGSKILSRRNGGREKFTTFSHHESVHDQRWEPYLQFAFARPRS